MTVQMTTLGALIYVARAAYAGAFVAHLARRPRAGGAGAPFASRGAAAERVRRGGRGAGAGVEQGDAGV